jgi:hypothetical protein
MLTNVIFSQRARVWEGLQRITVCRELAEEVTLFKLCHDRQ